jgi:predicted RNA-binding Zn ribbon-like protein
VIVSLALELAGTIRHDGHGGVADDLTEPAGLTSWVRERTSRLGEWAGDFTADTQTHTAVLTLRAGVRTLFAHAVRPAPPSRADVHSLLQFDEALRRVNSAAAAVPVTPLLEWRAADDSVPVARSVAAPTASGQALIGALARAAIDFLTGPHRPNLRACTAPRCVRYFVKEHGRQEFCKTSCSNRARAARHYQRRQGASKT